jgi:small subunit ribosomal protein S2
MRPYIFTERNGIHILDLHQTLKAIRESYDIVRDSVMNGGKLLFVGTKRQAQETIAREAERCGMPYINERWLGGTLTNWRTIRQRIDHLRNLEARRDRGEFELITKKEALDLTREIADLNERLGGIRNLTSVPDFMFVVDVEREATAIHEANILNIPVMAMVDTNGNPDMVDYVIPSNDDAIRAIKLVASVMADAVLEGIAMRKDSGDQIDETMASAYDYPLRETDDGLEDEEFLGEATLAKLRSGSLSFGDDDDAAAAETVTDVAEFEAEDADEDVEISDEEQTEQEAE